MFIGYTAEVGSHQDVRDIYKRLKLTEPNARHIVCAYRLPGTPHLANNFHDDGEPGSGRSLLSFLEEHKLEYRAVFVVRRYGGIKLGSDRFNMYIQAARLAIDPDQTQLRDRPRQQFRPHNTRQAPQRDQERELNDTQESRDSRPRDSRGYTNPRANTQRSYRPYRRQRYYSPINRSQRRNYKGPRGSANPRTPYRSTQGQPLRGGRSRCSDYFDRDSGANLN